MTFQKTKDVIETQHADVLIRACCDMLHCEREDRTELIQGVRHMDGHDIYTLYVGLPEFGDGDYDNFYSNLDLMANYRECLSVFQGQLINLIEEEEHAYIFSN